MASKSMVRRILFFVVAIALSIGCMGESVCAEEDIFTPEEREYVESLGVLKVGYVGDRIPISFKEEATGELGGVSRAIFDRIQEISGLKFEYQELPSGSVTYDYLAEQKFDLITSVEYNKQNLKANGILLSEPYLSSKKVIVGHKGVTLDSGENLKIAVATGSQTLKKVLKEQYPSFEIVDYDSIGKCFEAVNEGQADFLIQNQYVAEYRMYKPQYENLTILPTLGLDDMLCFSAVLPLDSVGTPIFKEKEMLIGIINKAADQISDDEIANYIIRATTENQYHDTPADFFYRYRYTVMVLFAAVLIVLILIYVAVRAHIHTLRAQADAETRTQFLSMMSHEIRTPLNGLLGLNYLITRNIDNERKVRDYLQQSSDVANYLLILINDILDMSKLQKKQMQLVNKAFAVKGTLKMIDSVSGSRMREKGIHFVVKKEVPYPRLVGDETRIEQVLLNVLDNAYKFTPSGGQVTIEISQEKQKERRICTKVRISDTGPGISEEFQKKIFDSFTQERSTVSKGNQGTGLGMAISRNLARLMGGDLVVQSKPGQGSTFIFTFVTDYVAEGEEDPETEPAVLPQTTEGRPLHVLVAEDNELNAEIVMDLLETAGLSATLASNGQDAVEMFAASDPGAFDCILMDLMMPVLNGYEAAKAIRSMDREDAATIRIIACSANAFEEDRQKAKDSGMDDFVAKPIDVDKLMEKLQG